ncbi:UTRA domain-containing protein [Streptomyces griseofuscus]|uniref:UTRA domain-containing protein n=1 Tax=Streptomyces griseofuscus TaxID=146922 RepID=UPI002683E793
MDADGVEVGFIGAHAIGGPGREARAAGTGQIGAVRTRGPTTARRELPDHRAGHGPGGVYARLSDLGHAPARFREELRSRMPTRPEADRLELPPGAPVIHLTRTAFDTEGRVIEMNEMVLDSAAYVLEYDFET